MKCLVISHAHPDFSVGGAEIAAYNLFQALKARKTTADATFLARTDISSLPGGAITQRRPGEYLWRQDMRDWFKLKSAYPQTLRRIFGAFLRREQPDVVFVQHYAHIGIEFLLEIRSVLPRARIILTFHEYMAICNHQGQMVKTDINKRLCYQSSPEDCHLCFKSISSENFWLRQRFIENHFAAVDTFVSPSHFLRQRYVDWGIEPERIVVIENGQPEFHGKGLPDNAANRRQVIGYFGQITEYKGVEVFLSAIMSMPEEARSRLVFEIHGANLDQQAAPFREAIGKIRDALVASGNLRWVGAYERREMFQRLSKVDWVVVPSIWWENSPMVIQEAFVCGKPVICSDIGGMAEKVQHGVTGFHFEARNAISLAATLRSVAMDPSLLTKMHSNIRQPGTYAEVTEQYIALVEE
ncbi:MAG: group 1 glycosyl transferase [Mesorhizobium amorphae]|nr:MAG: group 1 glycosyl transferase [Mesorhizobium amorphae]